MVLAAVPSVSRRSILQRPVVLGLIVALTFPFLALAAASAWRGSHEAEARIRADRLAIARSAALTASSLVDNNSSTLKTVVRSGDFADAQPGPALDRRVQMMLSVNPEWDAAGLVDGAGWNLVGINAPVRSASIADRPYFQQVMASNHLVVSPALLSRRTGNPTVVLAEPVDFRDGTRGAFAVALSTANFSDSLNALRGDSALSVVVVDNQGQAFVHPDPAISRALTSLADRPEVQAVLRGESGVLVSGSGAEETLVAYAAVSNAGWGVLIYEPADSALGPARRQFRDALLLLGIAALVSLAIGWFLGGRLSRSYAREQRLRERAEAAAERLRRITAESESRRRFLEELISSAPVAIAVLEGVDHRLLTVNPHFQAIKPDTEMRARTLAEAFPELVAQGLSAQVDRVYETGSQISAADQPITIGDDVEPRYFTLVLSRYDGSTERSAGVLVIAAETTAAVRLRRQTERAKDEFLSLASHELKTPLTSLALLAQMIGRLAHKGPPDLERLTKYASGVEHQVGRASRLISDLLDVSRLEMQPMQLRREPVDLLALSHEVAERQRDAADESGDPAVRVEAPDERPLVVLGDEVRLDLVLTNLLSNAIKYSPSGSAVTLRLDESDERVSVRVIDHGVGIRDDEKATLFAPFGRTASARKSGVEGTGLGLYIARRIVEAHDGEIRIEDTPGGGATFSVVLPAASRNGAEVGATQAS